MKKFKNLSLKQLSASAALPGMARTSPVLFVDDPIASIRKAHEMGFAALEIHARENAPIDFDALMQECDLLNMSISLLITGRLAAETGATLTNTDPKLAKLAQDGLFKYVDNAHKCRCNLVIGWIRGPKPDSMSQETYEDTLASALRPICEYAQQKNVMLLIEALNRYEINTFSRGEQVLSFIEKYGLPSCGLLLDIFHMNLEEVALGEAIRANRRNLHYVHFADSNRHHPGAGHMDIDEVLAALDEINFKGWLATECLPEPDYDTAICGTRDFFAERLN